MQPFHIENRTPFVFEPLVLADEELRPLLVPVVKATFDIGRDGRCARAESQVPLCLAGECWGDDPASSSYRYEPEGALAKPATDVALIGHAYAERRDTRELLVSLRVGPLGKTVLVQGEHVGSVIGVAFFHRRSSGGRVTCVPAAADERPRSPIIDRT